MSHRIPVWSIVLAAGLAGCASTPDTASRAGGESAGPVSVAGLLTGDDSKFGAAMAGASSLAMQGGAVGYYMDRQESVLREQLRGTAVIVVRKGNNVTLDMPGAVSFLTDRAELQPSSHAALDKVAAALNEYGKTVIEVAGHTDDVGSDARNQQLSEQRANSVAAYLSSRGVKQARIVTIGAGKTYPVATNATEAGRAANRRVEITIVPVTQDSLKK